MSKMEEHRLTVEILRTKLALLERERLTLMQELASSETPRFRRAMVLTRRAELQKARKETIRLLENLGERV